MKFPGRCIVFHILLLVLARQSYACSCVGQRPGTEAELNFVALAIKGKVIRETVFAYYDTLGRSLPDTMNARGLSLYVRRYKLYTIVVELKFKAPSHLPDTISIITGFGGGDCGYEFTVGKDYLIYAEHWTEKVMIKKRRRQTIKEVVSRGKFQTNICRLTQESNKQELNNLRRLTQ
ncbi:MAG TPA: hypothetical protein VD996_05810 [Chitinophagaceae bacterium]|nr:hypothetical protein [Chitinophagaceae bacterium]